MNLDAEYAALQAAQRDTLLAKLTGLVPAPVLAAFRAHPEQIVRLLRGIDVGGFATDPESGVNATLWAVVEALQALAASAGPITPAPTGNGSRDVRNARIVELWATVGKGGSERNRAQIIRNKLGRYAPSRSTILRIVKPPAK